jgi:hypothetical protein
MPAILAYLRCGHRDVREDHPERRAVVVDGDVSAVLDGDRPAVLHPQATGADGGALQPPPVCNARIWLWCSRGRRIRHLG